MIKNIFYPLMFTLCVIFPSTTPAASIDAQLNDLTQSLTKLSEEFTRNLAAPFSLLASNVAMPNNKRKAPTFDEAITKRKEQNNKWQALNKQFATIVTSFETYTEGVFKSKVSKENQALLKSAAEKINGELTEVFTQLQVLTNVLRGSNVALCDIYNSFQTIKKSSDNFSEKLRDMKLLEKYADFAVVKRAKSTAKLFLTKIEKLYSDIIDTSPFYADYQQALHAWSSSQVLFGSKDNLIKAGIEENEVASWQLYLAKLDLFVYGGLACNDTIYNGELSNNITSNTQYREFTEFTETLKTISTKIAVAVQEASALYKKNMKNPDWEKIATKLDGLKEVQSGLANMIKTLTDYKINTEKNRAQKYNIKELADRGNILLATAGFLEIMINKAFKDLEKLKDPAKTNKK